MYKKQLHFITLIAGVLLFFLAFALPAKADGEAQHTDHTGWTAVTALPAPAAETQKVYLTADLTLTSSYTMVANQELILCLNGHNITGDLTGNLFETVDGAKLTICNCGDHDDTHGVINGSSKVNNIVNIEKKTGAIVGVTVDNVTLQNAKAAIFCNDGSSPVATVTVNRAKLQGFTFIGLYMRGYRTVCEITGNTEIIGSSSATREFYLGGDTSTCNFRSGVIKNMVQGAVAIAGSAKFNMYDGASITDCRNNSNNSGNGGAVRINNYANSTFTMYGGEITNCTGKNGGAVYVTTGKFDMQGGEITNCTATGTAYNQGGGAVYLNSGVFSMSGGKIQDCQTEGDRGGAVYSWLGTVNISGTALIGGEGHENKINLNQTNGGYGAGVHAYGTVFTMTGGEISHHKVVYGGANLSLFESPDKGSTATISGGRITDGYLTGSNINHMGANICVYGRSTLAIGSNSEANKPVISGGTNTVSGGLGGNIGLRQQSSLTISGYSEISGGKAFNGGNIYAESSGTFTITGHPDISNGTATVGADICINGTTAAFTGAVISGGDITLTNGSLTMENCRAGDLVLVKGTVHLSGNRFNSASSGDTTMNGVLTDGYFKVAPAPEMLKGSGSIVPGSYVFDGETYNYKVESTYALLPPSNVTYQLNNDTDGFAGGLLTVTLPSYDENITFDFEMYWGDENGKLPGYTRLPRFQATGETTYFVMNSESLIPVGATRLMVYTIERATGDKTEDAFVVTLPEGAASKEPTAPYKEFQVVSDVHIDERDSFAIHREHFNGMLNDIAANSPDSIGLFIVGDIANCGYESEYQLTHSMHDAVAGVPPMFWSIGNHEMKIYDTNVTIEEVNDLFVRYARLPDGTHPEDTSYDFWLEGYHFIFLGTDVYNQLTAVFEDETYEWLENALQENRDASRPTFLFLHQSIFNTVAGCMEGQWEQGTDRETGVRLANVLKNYPEVVFFNGHSHYEMTLPNDHYKPTAELPINIFNTAAVAYISTDYGDYGNSHREVGSQGFYVRVYEDRIRVYAKDFVTGEWIPSAMYELNLADRTPHADPEVPNTATGHVHCVCGAEHQSFTGGHGSEFPIKFTEVNSSTGLPIPGRDHVDYVYLTSDITLSSTYVLASGQKLYICLNGHTIRGTGSNRLFYLSEVDKAEELMITDCSAGHTGTLDACGSASNPYKTESYTDVEGNAFTDIGGGMIVRCWSSGGNKNLVRMFNVTLKNGHVGSYGGGAVMCSGPASSFYNCTFEDCSATGCSGGAVYLHGARSTYFYNCKISNCQGYSGGAIYAANPNTKAILMNTEIMNCTAANNGGAVGSNGFVSLYDGAYIHGCSAVKGGAVYVGTASSGSSTLYMFDGTIADCSSTSDGGAIWCGNKATIYNGTIIRNRAESTDSSRSGGGAIYTSGTLKIKGGIIGGSEANKNSAKSQGGSILQEGGTFIMTGGEVSYGSGVHGGNIVIQSKGVGEITGGNVSYGTSTNYAGNVGLYSVGSKLTIGGCARIIGGNAATYGGNVLARDADQELTITGNALIVDGVGPTRGADVSLENGTTVIESGYFGSVYKGSSATVTVNGGFFIEKPADVTIPEGNVFAKGTFFNPDETDARTYQYTPLDAAELPHFASTISAEVGESFALRFKAVPGTIEGIEVLLQLTKKGELLAPIPMTDDGEGNLIAVFSLDPDDLTEDLQPTLMNGDTVLQEKGTYRAIDYIKAVAMSVSDEKIRTLLADLAEYGAAAQLYYNHKADDLANAEAYRWTGYQPSAFTAPENVPEMNYQAGDDTLKIRAANLWLEEDTVTLQFKGVAPEDATFTLNGASAEPEWTGSEFKLRTEAIFVSRLSDTVVTAVVSKDGVTSRVTYSAATYVDRIRNSTENEAMKALAERLWAYALSAKAAR